MQPRRRRRHCSWAICIDCLISLLVIGFWFAFDVRRQRDLAISFHDGEDIFLVESDIEGTVIQVSAFNDEPAAVFPIKFDSRPWSQPPSWPEHCLPGLVGVLFQKECLCPSSRPGSASPQSGGNDLGIVENQTISWAQQHRERPEFIQLVLTGASIQQQHPGTVPIG